jgi:hypothetical protein
MILANCCLLYARIVHEFSDIKGNNKRYGRLRRLILADRPLILYLLTKETHDFSYSQWPRTIVRR